MQVFQQHHKMLHENLVFALLEVDLSVYHPALLNPMLHRIECWWWSSWSLLPQTATLCCRSGLPRWCLTLYPRSSLLYCSLWFPFSFIAVSWLILNYPINGSNLVHLLLLENSVVTGRAKSLRVYLSACQNLLNCLINFGDSENELSIKTQFFHLLTTNTNLVNYSRFIIIFVIGNLTSF